MTQDPAPPASPGPTRLLLLRHAETAEPGRFHGAESDVDLGARGRRQAQVAAEAVARLRPDALFCSGMRRARATAEAIGAAAGLEPAVIPALHERRMGPLSGQERATGLDAYEATMDRWAAGDLEHAPEGTESYASIRARAVPPLLEILEAHRGRTVAVVAHGVVIRVILTTLLEGLTPADFRRVAIRPAAINDLRWDGRSMRAEALDLAPTGYDTL